MSLPPIPYDTLHAADAELLDVLALLRVAHDSVGGDADADGMTDAGSRTRSLVHLADARVRAVLQTLSPHV